MTLEHHPVYDIEKSYAENVAKGPFFQGKIPERKKTQPTDFLGFQVNSTLGVPAGPLLTSKWVELAGKLGFDIPTYKTIRSGAYEGHGVPNVIYVERVGAHRASACPEPLNEEDLTITNSFGMPSQSPEFLMQDIERGNHLLSKGQVMIVSVVGSVNTSRSFIDDFVYTASMAKEAGAKIVEVNFSCPNVAKKEGFLYLSSDAVFEFTRKISAALKETPLIIKVGQFPDRAHLEHVCIAAAKGGAQGICGLNSVSMEVVNEKGEPALGQERKTSGICGTAIRPMALHFIRDAAAVIMAHNLDLTLMGCGGIVNPEHFDQFFEAGADVAMSATGFMWDPYLATRYHDAAQMSSDSQVV